MNDETDVPHLTLQRAYGYAEEFPYIERRAQTVICFPDGCTAAFLQKYGLGGPSTAARLLAALTEKELLLETKTLNGSSYCVYNVFFSRWLERL